MNVSAAIHELRKKLVYENRKPAPSVILVPQSLYELLEQRLEEQNDNLFFGNRPYPRGDICLLGLKVYAYKNDEERAILRTGLQAANEIVVEYVTEGWHAA